MGRMPVGALLVIGAIRLILSDIMETIKIL